MAVVYRHRRNDTGEVFYVGVASRSNRPYDSSHRNKYWHNIVNKAGRTVEILAKGISREDAIELEMFLIEEYGKRVDGNGCLVNITDGGDGLTGYTYKMSDEHKQKISAANKGRCNKKAVELARVANLKKPRKQVIQMDMEGNEIKRWHCAEQAERELKIWNIGRVCKKQKKSAGGYKWKYANN